MTINKHSGEWKTIEDFITRRIEKLKTDLVSPQDEASTTMLRARIMAFKDVLKLGDDPTKEEA